MRLALGIDIGGTKIAYALVNENGTILATQRIKAEVGKKPTTMLDHIAEGIQVIMQSHDLTTLDGIGIGSPRHR